MKLAMKQVIINTKVEFPWVTKIFLKKLLKELGKRLAGDCRTNICDLSGLIVSIVLTSLQRYSLLINCKHP